MKKDPYVISEDTILEPPSTFIGKLKFLGPGFILSASIVGSGELIATTVLGAKAGFAALWIIRDELFDEGRCSIGIWKAYHPYRGNSHGGF